MAETYEHPSEFHWLRPGINPLKNIGRDSKGNEVDLLMTNGADIFPIEIKAGMTITRDYFKGLNHFTKIFQRQ